MEYVIRAATLLRLLAALAAIQVSFGDDLSACQIPANSGSSCQESVLVHASAQLIKAENEINGININSISHDISEALERIDKAVVEAEKLKTQGIYMSRSHKSYVKLAETLASQVGRQDCYLNYTRPVTEDIYSTACARISFAVLRYTSNLNQIKDDLFRLKVIVADNPPSTQLPLLQSCLFMTSSGPQSVRDCLQLYVYNYKVYIRDITAQVASGPNRIMSAEQCPYFTALRNNIDDSVALAAYNLKQYAEEVLYCAGLSPRGLYEKSLKEIDTYISLYNHIIHQQQNVVHEINYADGNFTTDFESTMRNYLSPIYKAVELGLLYTAPEKHASLNAYIANAENMIQSILVSVSTHLTSTRDKLVAINTTLENAVHTLKQAIDNAVNGVNSCVPKCIDDYINMVNEFSCFTESLNIVRSILSDVKNQSSTAATQFQPDPDNDHNILRLIGNDYAYIYNYGKTTADEIFDFMGLTMDDSLPEQIVISLINDYEKNVSQMTKSIQPVESELQNYTEAVINRLDSDVNAALKPIENIIKVIQDAQPGVNVSTLNMTYNQLYENLKQNLTNYINGAYLNFTDTIDSQTTFNLTAQSEELKADLECCVSENMDSTTTGLNNPENMTKCFEPYVKNFTAIVNTILESIRTVVEGADSLKNTAVSSVMKYTSSALQNATATAIVVAETSVVQFNVTLDALDKRAVNQLAYFQQAEIDPLVNYINQVINNVKRNNFVSLANLTSSVNASVEPWTYAISICNTTNPSIASKLISQYPLINQLINNTLNSIYSTVIPYKEDALVIQEELTNFSASLNKIISNYNSTALATRCSTYSATPLQYIECLNNVTEEAKTVINAKLLPELQSIVDDARNLTDVANTNLAVTVATQLDDSYHIAKMEGNKIISMCNVTAETIQKKSLEELKSYNVTPIYNYAASVRSFADRVVQRSAEMLNIGNYMLYTSIYVMNDAVGSASYVTGWKYSFANESGYANSVIDQAKRKCLSTFPNVTQDANDLYATAVNITTTMDHQVSMLVPSQISTKCEPYLTDYYSYYECIRGAVNRFGTYYANGLKAAKNASDTAYKLLVNSTARLNSWKDKVITPEAANIVEMLKPLAEKLLTDYNCTVDKLLGYATHIIGQRYAQNKPNITYMAAAISTSATNVLQTNQSNIVDIRPSLLQLLQPLDQFIDVVKNSTNQTALTEDVLNAPSRFVANASAALQAFLKNITAQAGFIQSNSKSFVDTVENIYQGLGNASIYKRCYNSNNAYPLLELVACYNRLHYDFYVFLEKAQIQLKAYSAQITDLDVNVVAVVTNYTNTLLAQFKRNVCVYTAVHYQMSGIPVPLDLQPCLTVADDRCKVEIIVDGKPKCIIFF